jgi:hypothetical protein
VLYRVDDKPVLLLCGTVPAYRALHVGDAGQDVRQLNRNLHLRGDAFSTKTEKALGRAVADVAVELVAADEEQGLAALHRTPRCSCIREKQR